MNESKNKLEQWNIQYANKTGKIKLKINYLLVPTFTTLNYVLKIKRTDVKQTKIIYNSN